MQSRWPPQSASRRVPHCPLRAHLLSQLLLHTGTARRIRQIDELTHQKCPPNGPVASSADVLEAPTFLGSAWPGGRVAVGPSMAQRKAVTKQMATRYVRASKRQKGRTLDEFCELTGWRRRHARRPLLAPAPSTPNPDPDPATEDLRLRGARAAAVRVGTFGGPAGKAPGAVHGPRRPRPWSATASSSSATGSFGSRPRRSIGPSPRTVRGSA